MYLKNKSIVIIFFTIFSIIGLSVVFYLLKTSKDTQIKQSKQLLLQESVAHYKTIKDLEIWHNKLGGVFKKTNDKDEYNFNIVSLKPKNSENQAFGFNKKGLEFFEKNNAENIFYEFSDNNKDFAFIGVLKTEEKCIQCHSNFKVGEVRGGIQVSIPLTNYENSIDTIIGQFNIFYTLVFIFFAVALAVIYYFISVIFSEKEKIEELNISLEQKVLRRTREIEKHYERELFLKKLLETISELNENLISSYSLSSIIEDSLKTLLNHTDYKIIIFGYCEKNIFYIRYIFGDKYNLLKKLDYTFEELKEIEILKSTYEAITTKHKSIYKDLKVVIETTHARKDDYDIKESISFPLFETQDDKKGFNLLSFYTDRENGFDFEEVSILETLSRDIIMAVSAYKQRQFTEKLQKEQVSNYEETILAFVDMIEQRDAYTAGHTIRVAQYARKIAEYLNIDEEMISKIEKAAILHDIGKIATPDTILLKPGKLNLLEYNLIKNHVDAGYKMLSKVKMYSELAEIMKYHHEHYDGTGYPYGYKGDQVPFSAQILVVADAFDAMTTNRIYKPRLSTDDAINELIKNSGTQFNPDIVDAAKVCLKNITIEQTSQLPKSDLEKQRFSYFFNDNLTGVYNEAYLNLVVNQIENLTYVTIIKLQKFNNFNKKYSWKQGNDILIYIANELKKHFQKNKIFRFEGDDFLILSNENIEFNVDKLNLSEFDKSNIIKIKSAKLVINNKEEIYKLYEYIEK